MRKRRRATWGHVALLRHRFTKPPAFFRVKSVKQLFVYTIFNILHQKRSPWKR